MFCDLWNCWWNCLCWWWRIVVNNRVLKTRVASDRTCSVAITSIYTIETTVFVSTAIVPLLIILWPYVLLFYLVNQQQNYFLRCGCMYYLHWCRHIHLFFIFVNDKQYWMYWPFHILYWCVYDFVKRNSILNANGIGFIMASDKTEYNVMLSRMVFIWCFFNIT